jgi:hypothetical protein
VIKGESGVGIYDDCPSIAVACLCMAVTDCDAGQRKYAAGYMKQATLAATAKCNVLPLRDKRSVSAHGDRAGEQDWVGTLVRCIEPVSTSPKSSLQRRERTTDNLSAARRANRTGGAEKRDNQQYRQPGKRRND